MARTFSNLVGVDDCPFARSHRGAVAVVGAVYARERLDGVVSGSVTRDGDDATDAIAAMIAGSPFEGHVQAVLLQGIAVGGFNVVDIHALAERLARPVLVVARRAPRMAAIRRALETRVPGGAEKWALIERAGPMEPVGGVLVQRAGLDLAEAAAILAASTVWGAIPEPLRVAHLIAGGVGRGASRGRA